MNNNLEELFVPYTESLELKELGFDESCLLNLSWINGYNHYTERINEPNAWLSDIDIKYDFSQFKIDFKDTHYVEMKIPTFSQAFKFFREKYNLKSWIEEHTVDTFIYQIRPHKIADYSYGETGIFKKYEICELECLRKLIEICKNTN